MLYRTSRRFVLATAAFLALAITSCGDDSPPTLGSNNDSTDLDAGSLDTGKTPDDAATSNNLAQGQCTGNDTSNCVAPPNASVAGCVIGQCAYQCEDGFADDNGDLGDPDGDGCEGTCIPSGDEICDGIDNDCDGETDEDFGVMETCTTGIGACEADGTVICAPDQMSTECAATPGAPAAEVCDGIDNDCDGEIDEEDPAIGLACDTGESGVCSAGTNVCGPNGLVCERDEEPGNEVCDGLDNNCDGQTDEGNPGGGAACDTGLDGICASGIEVCDGSGGFDCQQSETAVSEDCGADGTGNGLDDDCDGQTDEGCAACIDGNTRPCYTGPSGTEGVGLCSGGTQSCSNGNWGSCNGQVLPTSETCNGLDDNCSGIADEDFSNLGQSCTSGTGACQAGGSYVCRADGSGTTCDATPGAPTNETCNGIDDDCDGSIDENVTRNCGSSTGQCVQGTETCSMGSWGSCVGGQGPVAEKCNGLDDDCDGSTDETFPSLGATCVVGTGACESSGTVVCNGPGTGTACNAVAGSGTSETCNGVDDDCDGSIDENLTRTCGTNQGVCSTGTETCNTGTWGACMGATTGSTESCNGVDDDCDGSTDEGFNVGSSCTVGTGACQRSGSRICNGSGNGTLCNATAGSPSTETCNGVDDDCDGSIDEGLTRSCGTNQGVCTTGTETCSAGSWGSCSGSVSPTSERCDGLDNDCDGSTDEGFGLGATCAVGTGACRRTGVRVCNGSGSGATCSASPGSPSAETCNGIDDDCDGLIDEGVTRSCGTNTGACSTGTEFCSNGSWGSCQGATGPTTETCNGVDDDCDGSTDEGVRTRYYLDSDNDGYGSTSSISACSPSGNYDVTNNDDCNDSDDTINPAASETCFDSSTDRDCDGRPACDDLECEGSGCVTPGGQLGMCNGGTCGGGCSMSCGPNSYCVSCGGFDDFCCPDGTFCQCP